MMASTSNVYDPDSSHPGREDDAVNPTLAYPASKIEAENELRKSGLNWSILRLPFVYGDKDGIVPPEFGEAYRAAIPGSRLIVLENAGHAPFDEQKDAFLATFRDFIGASLNR